MDGIFFGWFVITHHFGQLVSDPRLDRTLKSLFVNLEVSDAVPVDSNDRSLIFL